MTDDIAGDKTAARRQSKTRQYYGFVGETNYNEAFIEELTRDFEESGYEGCDIPLLRDGRIVVDIPGSPTAGPSYGERGCLWPSSWVRWPGACRSMRLPQEYGIEQEDVRAAIGYAARIVSQEDI